MPIPDLLLSPAQEILLRNAAKYRLRFTRGKKIEPFGSFAELPEKTVLEIVRTVRDQYADAAEVFLLTDGSYMVAMRQRKALLAVSPELGEVTENQPFRLSPRIAELAKANTEPAAQREQARSNRIGLLVIGAAAIVIALFFRWFAAQPSGTHFMFAFLAMAGIVFALVYLVEPRLKRKARDDVRRALAELQLA